MAKPPPPSGPSGPNDPCIRKTTPDLLARLRARAGGYELAMPLFEADMREAAFEIERMRRFVQYVADHSNDPQVVKEAMAHGAK